MKPLPEVLRSAFGWFESWYGLDGGPGIFTGLRELDEVIGGLRAGTLTVIEGDPAVRTASHLLLQIATSVSARRTVAFFSLDLSSEHTLVQRLLRSAGVTVEQLSAGAEGAWAELIKAAGSLAYSEASFWLNDRYDLSPTELEGECWKLVEGSSKSTPACVAFVDSVHSIRTETRVASDAGQVCETLERLAAAARRLRIPIVVTANHGAVALEGVEAINVLIRASSDETGDGPWPPWPAEYRLEVVRNDAGPRSTFFARVEQ